MARRRKGRRGGRKSKSIPMAVVLPGAYPMFRAYSEAGGINELMVKKAMAYYTGYFPGDTRWRIENITPFAASTIAGVVVHKVATKVGLNRHLKKATMGYLVL